MAIDPWEALRGAVRVAHLLGPTRGAIVGLGGTLITDHPPGRGVRTLYAVRAPSADRANNTYTLTTDAADHAAQVYWLPWGHNEMATIDTLDRSGADLFLTSEFSGCHFVGCDGVIMHTAAGYKSGVASASVDMDDRMEGEVQAPYALTPANNANEPGVAQFGGPVSFYGKTVVADAGAPRAIVVGWKSPLTQQWFFAFQDTTVRTTDYGMWNPLRG
ncbi:MAG TPA: hypothetical protein VG939_21545 [Caulobacteraceae bacterium]|nr:hypothetical protein [Caulobacteraceae bacterium]